MNPGHEEDRQGRPFVGPSGSLLTKVMLAGVSLPCSIYLTNSGRCFSPVDPPQRHLKTCTLAHLPADLRTLLSLHSRLVVLTLGAKATATFSILVSGKTCSLSSAFKHNGAPKTWEGAHLTHFATFHPAAVLRDNNLIHPVSTHMQLLSDHLCGRTPLETFPTIVPLYPPP
jgi:DNA polymerase